MDELQAIGSPNSAAPHSSQYLRRIGSRHQGLRLPPLDSATTEHPIQSAKSPSSDGISPKADGRRLLVSLLDPIASNKPGHHKHAGGGRFVGAGTVEGRTASGSITSASLEMLESPGAWRRMRQVGSTGTLQLADEGVFARRVSVTGTTTTSGRSSTTDQRLVQSSRACISPSPQPRNRRPGGPRSSLGTVKSPKASALMPKSDSSTSPQQTGASYRDKPGGSLSKMRRRRTTTGPADKPSATVLNSSARSPISSGGYVLPSPFLDNTAHGDSLNTSDRSLHLDTPLPQRHRRRPITALDGAQSLTRSSDGEAELKHRSSADSDGSDNASDRVNAASLSASQEHSGVMKIKIPKAPSAVDNDSVEQPENGYDDLRQKAKTFERTVEALFGLTPRDGRNEDKFKLALENISKHDESPHIQVEKGAVKPESETEQQGYHQRRRTGARRESEPIAVDAKAGSSFARMLKRASQVLIQQQRAGAAATTKANRKDSVLDTGGKLVSDASSNNATSPFSTERSDLIMERELEAVFVSFALFGKWDGDAMVTSHDCQGMVCSRFHALCKAAGLLNGRISPSTIRNVFEAYTDKGTAHSVMSFPNFVCALDALASEAITMQPTQVYRVVSALNVEKRLCVHSN